MHQLGELGVVLKTTPTVDVSNVCTDDKSAVVHTSSHDHAHVGIMFKLGQCFFHGHQHGWIQRIELVRLIETHDANLACFLGENFAAAHVDSWILAAMR